MWKDSFKGHFQNNRSFGFSVRISALMAALFLSLLCGLFYNAWKYEVERIVAEEGGWQSRILGDILPDAIASIQNYANVKEVVIHKKENGEEETVADLYFSDYRTVFSDMPRIAELAGIPPETVIYNYELLAMYLVRDEKDAAPRLLFPMFLIITLLASFSLIVIIHNAFAVSMQARVHQIGIFSSVGATPRQIRIFLLQEAAVLCAVPILAGNLLGMAGSMGLTQLSNLVLGSNIPGRHPAVPGCHPLVLMLTLFITIATILISAWLPARKLSRLTPLEAIRNPNELQLKRRKKPGILALLGGAEGELAANALLAQKKALRTASLSLVCSFFAFTVMQCFFAMSEISTRETYFERYQDAWDIMVTVWDASVDEFAQTQAVQSLGGVESAVVYQKAMTQRLITEEEISEEMKSFGGFSHASSDYVTKTEDGWLVNAPLIILDDHSFYDYCEQIGITPRLDGAVVLNKIRDVTNPDFRHPVFMPYIKISGIEENAKSVLRQPRGENRMAEITILSDTQKAPVLREEYAALDHYELVHFLPASLWKAIKEQVGGREEELSIRVLGKEDVTLEELRTLQNKIRQLLGTNYKLESENRIQEYEMNRIKVQGMQMIFGSFCVLLAVIGIGNVFSNTFGFVYQRKREFARYLSVGMTPAEIRNMFCMEALVLALRPVVATLLLAVPAVGYMMKMSYLEEGEFLAEAPFVPIIIFILAVTGFAALAYCFVWRTMRRICLAEVLRDDTMM